MSKAEDKKKYRGSTHRVTSPRDTFERIQPMMSRMGITRVANVTGLDRIGIPVVQVTRPNSRSIAVSQGKGINLNTAKTSGLMESVEMYHAERIDLPLRVSSARDFSGHGQLIDLEALPRPRHSPFDETTSIPWIRSQDLYSNQLVWLPYELVHTQYTLPSVAGSGNFFASSNGLASGNTKNEAIMHAICEVIERDSTSVWHHYNKRMRDHSQVDMHTIDHDLCRQVIDKLHEADLHVAVWNTTTDAGVPSFLCYLLDMRDSSEHLGVGAGCHPAREIALLRALLEAVQVRTTYITGSRDDLTRREYQLAEMVERMRTAQILMECKTPGTSFNEIESNDFDTFEADIAWLLQQLEAVGVTQVLAVDLTKEEFEIPVARVVIPGLEAPHDEDTYDAGPRAIAASEMSL